MTDPFDFERWRHLNDADLSAELARTVGGMLVSSRADLMRGGATKWELKDAGDLLAHHFLLDAFNALRPDDAVLSEEGADDRERLSAERVWIIDPLDGTNEYGEGRSDWAVHVALWQRGALTDAAVSLPAIDRVFRTSPAEPLPVRHQGRPRLVTSRTRAPYSAVIVAEQLDCEAFRLGSAGAKAMSILMGEADIYVHDGGMNQWDSAAPAAVALAAGLHASRVDGSPLVYNEADTWLPDFLVCRKELATDVLRALWGHDPR